MRHPLVIALAAAVALLLTGAAGVYAYDASRDDLIAEGVTVGGIHVGGMRAGEARAVLERRLADPISRPVDVKVKGREFTLSAERANVSADLVGMVREALELSRDGGIVSRTFRGLTGGTLDANVEPRVTWSREAVAKLVDRVEEEVERDPRNASVEPSASGLDEVKHEEGLAVRAKELEREINAELADPDADRVVKARTKALKPDVTTGELAEQYPYFIVVNRSKYQLRFYRDLKLEKTFDIAVGRSGLETPAGLYHIQNKQVNPTWYVPNSDWAGELAGQVIPPGPSNPLKARWMGFYNGAGIHGTDDEGSIGTNASAGCIRMRIPQVKDLYDQIPVRTPIYIA